MKKIVSALLTLSLLATAAVAPAATQAPLSTPELKQTIGTHNKATLIFFQNPNGGPCKAQKKILDKLAQDKGGSFNLASVSVMNQGDQKAFYDYGVRSLPSLVLVDKSGAINKVFSPGIQSIETLIAALDGLK